MEYPIIAFFVLEYLSKLNTYYMSWDIVNGKVLEFSVTATLQHPPHYYDINTKKKVIPRRWGLGTLEY